MSNPRLRFGPNAVLGTKIIIAGSVLALMLYTIYEWMGIGETGAYEIMSGVAKDIGNALFTEWGVVVLVLGLVLFVAMMGGVFIAQEEDE